MTDVTKPCARCGINPRDSTLPSYCTDCKRALQAESYARVGGKNPQTHCSRCKQVRTGRHMSYCPPCASAYRAEKPCPKCGASKAGKSGTKSPYCVPCYREHRLLKTYGITVADFEVMLIRQGGVCAVCSGGPGDREWHVDHCHDSNRVRGILCAKCNMGIGLLGESASQLRAAADYLER